MKSKLIKMAFVIAIAVLGGINVFNVQQSEEAKVFSWNDFESEVRLKGKTLTFDDDVMMPFSIQVFDSVLVTLEPTNDRISQLFNLNTGKKIGTRIESGEGPNEMIMPMFVNNGKEIQFIDMASATIYKYEWKHFLSEDSPSPSSKVKLAESVDSEMQMLGEYFVGYQYFKEDLLYLFDKQGQKIKPFAGFPNGKADSPDEKRSNMYQMGYISNGKDRVAITYYMTDIIEIFDAEGKLIHHLQGPENFEYEIGKDAFFSPKNAGDSFFVLYNGRNRNEKDHNSSCSKLLSFSWDGTPECVYILDDPIFTFCVDKQKGKIYGVSTTPEYHIVEYTLP